MCLVRDSVPTATLQMRKPRHEALKKLGSLMLWWPHRQAESMGEGAVLLPPSEQPSTQPRGPVLSLKLCPFFFFLTKRDWVEFCLKKMLLYVNNCLHKPCQKRAYRTETIKNLSTIDESSNNQRKDHWFGSACIQKLVNTTQANPEFHMILSSA